MDRKNGDRSGYIEEYKELRAEIRHYLDRRAKNINFAFAITTAIVGLSEKINEPYIFIFACLITAFLWHDEIRRYVAIQRVAAYLELFIEPNVEGFNWETYGAKHSIQGSFSDRILSNGVFPLTFVIHAYLTIKFSNLNNVYILFLASIPFFVIFLTLTILTAIRLKKCRKKEIEEWLKIKKELT